MTNKKDSRCKRDIICYNCGTEGHYICNCELPENKPFKFYTENSGKRKQTMR